MESNWIIPERQAEYQQYVDTNKSDGYSKAVVDYGEQWMAVMERDLSSGAEITPEFVIAASHEADTDGVTGYMSGAAASAITHFWRHGDAFREAYNKHWGVDSNAQGTVNPAILTFDA